jgi:integrase
MKLKMNKNYSNNFVFPILNNEDFKDIKQADGFDKMNELQYKRFTGRRGYYNRLLKQVGNQCNIDNLTSHMSRHSYTSLLLKNKDVNLFDLMKSLGHKNLSTTQVYIQNFSNTRIDLLGKEFSDTFTKNMSINKFT